jgi:hypothetical protein
VTETSAGAAYNAWVRIGVRWMIGLATLVCAAGCEPQTRVCLLQPSLPGRQAEVDLSSELAYYACEAEVDRYLVEFPLPGATVGRPMYLLYFRLPADTGDRERRYSPADLGGFLIQTRGRYAGLVSLTGGTIQITSAGDRTRRLVVDVYGEDGMRLHGKVRAVRNEGELRRFEQQRRPGDVQALLSGQARPG